MVMGYCLLLGNAIDSIYGNDNLLEVLLLVSKSIRSKGRRRYTLK